MKHTFVQIAEVPVGPAPETDIRRAGPEPLVRTVRGETINGVTYDGYAYTLVVQRLGGLKSKRFASASNSGCNVFLRSETGRGTISYQINDHCLESTIKQIAKLPDQALFAVLHSLCDTRWDALDEGREAGRRDIVEAFLDGRLRKRRDSRSNEVTVRVDPPAAVIASIPQAGDNGEGRHAETAAVVADYLA